jgi:N-formylglutamate amidohydrolase
MNSTMTKREQAQAVLSSLFAGGRNRIPIAEAVQAASEVGVSRRTLTRAARDLGVTEVHNGPYPAYWELPPQGGQ